MLNRTEKLNPILATMLIISLTLYYFIFVANTAITYAIDIVKTNSHNVDFSAYFVNENGEKVDNISRDINSVEYLYVDIDVKNEGYFEGEIEIQNGNFTISEEILSNNISKIEGNKVVLKQINSGNKVTIKLEISAIKKEILDISNLKQKSNIILTGKYVNSKNIEKQDNVDVTGNTYIEINWISNENISANLNANVITNYVYNENKIIQLLVESNIASNSYPVKNTEINLTVPEKVQDIKVHSRENNATNSNVIFDETNYAYIENEKILKINVANNDENLISWNKDAKDIFVVTYVFERNVDINENITINSAITTYDNKVLTANKNISIDNQKLDGIVSFEVENNENAIYKGKIYTGEERDYLETLKLNVDYIDGINEIKFNADESKYYTENKESTANIFYKEVKINRNKFINLFGKEGVITFKTLNGEEIAKITGDSEQDEDGDIVITFSNEIKELSITTSKPIAIGEIKFNVTKKITNSEYEREDIKEIKGIETNYVGSYNNKELYNDKKQIELKDTETMAKFTVNEKTFYEEDENKKVKITTTLLNNDESKDLYKNPEINIKLPNELNINSAKCKILYGNGLKIESATLNNDKENSSVKVKLSGEQSEYNTEIVEGTKIIIYADVTVKDIVQDIEDKVIMSYSNDYSTIYKDNGIQEKNIKLVAATNEENYDEITNEKIKNLKSSLKAYVGGEELKDEDKVYAGEIITYELKLENLGEESIENLEIEAIIPENTTLISYNPNYPGDYDKVLLEYTYNEEFYKELSETEKKDIITIENNKDVILSYNVKIKTDLETELKGEFNLKIKKDNESLKEYIISNIFSPAELGMLIRPLDRIANSYLTYNVSYSYLLEISNFTNRELTNLKVTLNKNDAIDVVNITQLNTDRDYSTLEMNSSDNSFVIDSIRSNETKRVQIVVQLRKDTKNIAEISAQIDEYKSNVLSEKIIDNDAKVNLNIIESSTTTSVQRNNYVSIGDSITYTIILKNTGTIYLENLRIQNQFSDYLDIKDIKFNGENIEYNLVDNFENNANYSFLTLYTSLDIGEEKTIVITGKVRSNLPDESDLIVINKSEVYKNEKVIGQTDDILYYIKRVAEVEEVDDDLLIDDRNGSEDTNDDKKTDDENKLDNESKRYSISGVAWLDEDKNGKRDSEEKNLSGIKVTIINIENNYSKMTITDDTGVYKFDDLNKGKYIEIFEYDTEKYELTTYRADGVTDKLNSDVENMLITIGNLKENAAATDTLIIEDSNQENIDIGLIEAKIFDLKLDKTISKLTISNAEGIKVQEYNDDVTLAQKQIRAKYISGTTVVVEYKIKVTNVGEAAGYARQIVDNKPKDMEFNSKLNSDWYQSGDKLYSTALANTKLEPGESKEIKLILTKTMTESNLGLTHNTAEITESYNSRGIKDKDSKSENKNEIGSADLIISVSTGGAITYISITLSLIVLIAFGAYIVLNKIVV